MSTGTTGTVTVTHWQAQAGSLSLPLAVLLVVVGLRLLAPGRRRVCRGANHWTTITGVVIAHCTGNLNLATPDLPGCILLLVVDLNCA
jgi:hypothetical protein